ncbi:hypothetical protein [Massilia glaciei]|uniref:hypothetical protein n=1 Tax=Massilia glaciei TaxID=1524097 RepID=UPI001E3442D2|nr:hypothetical protein [Massilia glaciei]
MEEAFKRLKHRLKLEHVTGLSQQAVVQDVVAKIVCDNLQALVAITTLPMRFLLPSAFAGQETSSLSDVCHEHK